MCRLCFGMLFAAKPGMRYRATILWLVMLVTQPVWGDEWQDHDAIRDAVAETLRAELVRGNDRIDVVVADIDRRVRLEACPVPLKVSLPYGRKQVSRLTAEVRCVGSRPWKINVPARLTVYRQVVVAARPLARGTVLAADDIMLAEQGGDTLGFGYLPDPEHALGHELRRPVAAGKVLTPQMLTAPTLIRRGQRVSLQAGAQGVSVRMSGIARSDGILGQVIDVENANSGRLVQAVVRSAKSAEVLLE